MGARVRRLVIRSACIVTVVLGASIPLIAGPLATTASTARPAIADVCPGTQLPCP